MRSGDRRGIASTRRAAVLAVWIAFLARGTIQVLITPIWDGFDEPFHVAYAAFVAENGRPPGFDERSFPSAYYAALPLLPSVVGHGAPDFRAWRQLSPEERSFRRGRAARLIASPVPANYAFANYERQQPPLFYILAAPVAWLFRHASVPVFVIALRLFCVLLASLLVPLTARLARLLLPQRGVFFALPLAALLPNTLFFVDRVTNDALAWPILAAIAASLVLVARRPGHPRRAAALGLLVAAGVWTKLTLLPALPAALVAALWARRRSDGRRPSLLFAAASLPALLIAPLFFWNHLASGSWTGIIYSVRVPQLGLLEGLRGVSEVRLIGAFTQWAYSHLWAGGWAFLQPPRAAYDASLAALLLGAGAALVVTRRRGTRIPGGSRWLAPATLAFFFFAAMLFHLLAAAAAARLLGTGPLAGGEGWYFDLLRPIEACAAAALLVAAVPARLTRAVVGALMVLLLSADTAGTFGLLLPHWAGLASAGWSFGAIQEAVRGARDAAPLLYPAFLPFCLTAVVCGACVTFVRLAVRKATTTSA
jgi:4-amino-4-deoxy-L-arabinose transferase-like glycosyltransferase